LPSAATPHRTSSPAPRSGRFDWLSKLRDISNLREHHKQGRRARILEATRELLREGEATLTTERIAQRAQVAPATVYNLIGPREKVWEALAAEFMEELDGRLRRLTAHDPVERARDTARLTAELFVEDPTVARHMLRGWEDSGLLFDRRPLSHVHDALAAAQAESILARDVDVGALTSTIGAAALGALHQWAAGIIDDARFVARTVRAVDVAVAAAATEAHRARLMQPLRSARTPRRRAA
jgi:AcrR family transcriptional regulator